MMGTPAAEMAAFHCHRRALLTVARFACGKVARVASARIMRELVRRIARPRVSEAPERLTRPALILANGTAVFELPAGHVYRALVIRTGSETPGTINAGVRKVRASPCS